MLGVTATAPLTTVTVDVLLTPPAPLHVNVYVSGADSAPVLSVPLEAFAPLHAPDAVQAVALVELHVSIAVPPAATAVGLTVSTAVGTTLTVTLAGTLSPPPPAQVSENVVLTVSAPVGCVPLGDLAPLHPPAAVQPVALGAFQVSELKLPAATTGGVADRVIVGTTLTVALVGALEPPGPVQVKTKVPLTDSAPVDRVPLVVREPLQPPVAAHDVALVEVQVSVAADPAATDAEEAVSAAVGTGVGCESPPPPQDASSNVPRAGHPKEHRIVDLKVAKR